jgi:hypothetical protein
MHSYRLKYFNFKAKINHMLPDMMHFWSEINNWINGIDNLAK